MPPFWNLQYSINFHLLTQWQWMFTHYKTPELLTTRPFEKFQKNLDIHFFILGILQIPHLLCKRIIHEICYFVEIVPKGVDYRP